MIVYFNNQGVMTTQLTHGSPTIRQGGVFEIDFLFEKDCPFISEKVLSIQFRKSGEKDFGNEFYLTKITDNYTFTKSSQSENTYSLVDGKQYIQYKFTSKTTYNLTTKFGELEGVIKIYSEIPLDAVVFQPSTLTRIYATGVVHLYVEKTYGNEPINYNISPTQYAYLISYAGSVKSYCDNKLRDFYDILNQSVAGIGYTFDSLEFNAVYTDIIRPKEDEMPSFPNHLRTGAIYSPNGEDMEYKSNISLASGTRKSTIELDAGGEESGATIVLKGTTAVGSEGEIEISGKTIFNTRNRLAVVNENDTNEVAYLSDIGYHKYYIKIMVDAGNVDLEEYIIPITSPVELTTGNINWSVAKKYIGEYTFINNGGFLGYALEVTDNGFKFMYNANSSAPVYISINQISDITLNEA